MGRKSFVLYTEWEDAFDSQPNDVAGELIKAIFDYVRSEEIPHTDNGIVNAMFSILRPAIDRNIGKYVIISPDWYRYITRLVPCATLSWYHS